MNSKRSMSEAPDDIKSSMKGAHPTCAQTCAFSHREFLLSEMLRITAYRKGCRLVPASSRTPLYLAPYLLPKAHPFILSSTNRQPSYQEDMRLKDKKERSNESVKKRKANGGNEEVSVRVGKCVDGRVSAEWEAKVDSGKIGKPGLKGLLRDGNISTAGHDDATATFKGQKTKTVSDSTGMIREIGNQRLYVIQCAKPLGAATESISDC